MAKGLRYSGTDLFRGSIAGILANYVPNYMRGIINMKDTYCRQSCDLDLNTEKNVAVKKY